MNRTIVFDDYSSPKIFLAKQLLYYASDTRFQSPRELIYAVDKLDGDISNSVRLSGDEVDYTRIGDYSITVNIENSFKDSAEYTLPLHVLDSSSTLYITLSQYLVYCELNSEFDPMKYVEGTSNDLIAPRTLFDLAVESDVDTSKPGVYEVSYTLSGETISKPAKAYLIVIVPE